MDRRQKPKIVQDIARQRINILLNLSKEELDNHPKRAIRYVQLAKKISTKYNERLNEEQKNSFCKKCNLPLIPGKNASVRIVSKPTKHLEISCQACRTVKKQFLELLDKTTRPDKKGA